MSFADWLAERHACEPGIVWTGNKDIGLVWKTCPRPDWMLWIAQRKWIERASGWPNHEEIARVAVLCAKKMVDDETCNVLAAEGTLKHAFFYQSWPNEKYAPLVFSEELAASGHFGNLSSIADLVRQELKVPL